MDKNELENTQINISNSSQILTEFAYPDLKLLFRIFGVLFFYMIIVGIVVGIFLSGAKNLLSPLLKSLLGLLSYIITLLFTIRYAVKKSKKLQASSFNISLNRMQGRLVPVVVISTFDTYA